MITDGAPKPKVVTSLKQFIGVLEAGGRSVGLVAPKAIEEAVGHVRSAHFNALRGVDRLKGLDTGIVVGRMLPPAFDVQAKARALFPFEAMEFGENKYVRKEAGYRMRSGARVGVTEWYHPDPRVDRVLRQHREAESSQAVDRFRLVYRDAPAEIFILSPLPLDVTVDGLIHDPLGDARLLEALERSGWVLPLVSDWLHGRMPDLFASEKAAKCWSLNAYRRTSHAPPAKNAENGASGPKKASEVLLGSMAHSSIDIYIETSHAT